MNITITLTSRQFELLLVAAKSTGKRQAWREMLDAAKALDEALDAVKEHRERIMP